MNFISYSEMWSEPDEQGRPTIRVAFDLRELPQESPARSRQPFTVAFKDAYGGEALFHMCFVAVIKGQAVFEARPVSGVPLTGPARSDAWQLIWSPLLART